MKQSYRSPNLPSGFFNIMGTAHVHIDGAQDENLILSVVKNLEGKGNPGKLNYVYDSIVGPQRKELPEIYESHTPVLLGKEALDFFSTNLVKSREDGIEIINSLFPILQSTPGLIVEMEQVVGWYREIWGDFSAEELSLPKYIPLIKSSDVLFAPKPTLSYEIHHGFEELKNGPPSIGLKDLLQFCEENKIMIGGWFTFANAKLIGLRTLVERVIGIWST